MPNEIPESLRRELHLRCDREITRKNLDILVRVGLAVEKKIGKARVFVRTNELREVPKYDLP